MAGSSGNTGAAAAAAAHIMAQTLSPLAAMPAGEGKIMTRNINGTCKIFFFSF